MTDKESMQEALQHPGMKLLMGKLQASADAAREKYDSAKDQEEFLRLQIYRSVVAVEIPRVIEGIVNQNEKGRWRFWAWLRAR
jgi:hypothetical protein